MALVVLALALMATAAVVWGSPARGATEGGQTQDPPLAAAASDAGAQAAGVQAAGVQAPVSFPGQVGEIVENRTEQRVPTRRYRGSQRFDTAGLIATDAFDDPTHAVLARGDLFPDALSGSFLAGQLDAPILLTATDRLTGDTLSALDALAPDRVTLVGGEAAIGPEVVDQLTQRGFATERVGGADRFETASKVATLDDATVGQRDGHGPTAIVARADEFADALVAGTLSYTADFPLLLTGGEQLHPATESALQQRAIEHAIVPGGSTAVSDDVVDEIEALGIDVQRVAGPDRVATSVAFAQFMREELGFGLDRLNAAIGT
ncbi:MAG: hypothetical protein BRC31_01790, partial [Actinobacteria bacterium QS_5_72_10]